MALSQFMNEEKYGSHARSTNGMIERLMTMNWYCNIGQQNVEAEKKIDQFMSSLNISEYEIKWISRKQLIEKIERISFEDNDLWGALAAVPDQLKEKIERAGNEKLLVDVVDEVPEAIFHGVYKEAFEIFGEEKTVKFLVGHAMYVSVLACAAELAEEKNVCLPIIELIEMGHVPLGPEGNTFYLL
ncbi:hypothetical protein [Bacillus toyonensis]|uniref:hypothetical protein n=1 Tax=Bacillus toyonensis TaxID=155322 RepID=UPI000BF4F497|nr:hypothetical protein [Bacillus toyonensis]PGE66613.1 hypothetical protein COM69_19170 [Bacillus toyonensis]PHD37269.1 hypothetical protein COF65_27075 [Bacillus toyonensis]PHD54208.1 hypothetical protein COF67_00935 [Bacillus toyonensis]PRT18733.1 hypothetical protein C6353_08930 [Bacillus toyonensis]